MRALICDDYGGVDALRVGEMEDPKPKPGSLLVSVESAGVNFADTLMVSGQYQVRPETPFAPGHEVAGTVLVANNCRGLSPGDRVCGFAMSGGIAEKAVVEADKVIRVPDTVTSEVASVIPVAYGTGYHALVDRAQIQPGESLLVMGAAGGVGLATVQLGHALGARVIAAVSSDDKEAVVTEAGAADVIRYDQTPLRDALSDISPRGVDVVFDPVGGDATEQALRSTAWRGRLLVIGFAAGRIPEIPLNLPLLKGNSILGVFWGRFAEEEPELSRANLTKIAEWVAEGRLDPLVQRSYPLDEAVDALRWVGDRNAIGKVIVKP